MNELFTPEDFESDLLGKINLTPESAARIANDKLNDFLERGERMWRTSEHDLWSKEKQKNNPHGYDRTGILVCEVKTDCEHPLFKRCWGHRGNPLKYEEWCGGCGAESQPLK